MIQCKSNDLDEPAFDIRIEQMIPDSNKQYPYWANLYAYPDCHKQFLNYFKDGYELSIKLIIHSDINEKLVITMSYFNHILSPASSFYSIVDGDIVYACNNDYYEFSKNCDHVDHWILKEGVYNMIMRVKFDDCEIKNGYLVIRFPFHSQIDLGNSARYEYINSWMNYNLYFPVTNGKVSNKPLYYHPKELHSKIIAFVENELKN